MQQSDTSATTSPIVIGIEVGKRNILVCVKIFIADIPATDNRDLIIQLEIPGMSAYKGIIQPYFHVGMCVNNRREATAVARDIISSIK